MKLVISPNCGNSPKSEYIKNLTIHFASYNLKKVTECLDDQVQWTLVGEEPINGKENFITELKKMSHNKVKKLTIHNIVTHGKEGAVNGEMEMKDGDTFGFSDFYRFTSAKGNRVKSIVSYVVKIK